MVRNKHQEDLNPGWDPGCILSLSHLTAQLSLYICVTQQEDWTALTSRMVLQQWVQLSHTRSIFISSPYEASSHLFYCAWHAITCKKLSKILLKQMFSQIPLQTNACTCMHANCMNASMHWILLVQGKFEVPVSKRTWIQRNTVVRFWRRREDFHLGPERTPTLYFAGKKGCQCTTWNKYCIDYKQFNEKRKQFTASWHFLKVD